MTASSTNEEVTLRVLDIVEGTSVDGPGLRTSVYLAGCIHHCPGCHNPESWDLHGGRAMTVGEIMEVLVENEFPVTLTGGDPFCQVDGAIALAREIKRRMGVDIWCYTGYRYEQILADESLKRMLEYIDILVDGPFVESLRDTGLIFRGSSNQRIIQL